MAIDFSVRDIIHKAAVKFYRALLPDPKKPYYLKVVHQPVLDIHGIASKAAMYNIKTSPRVIEEGLTAAIELIYYLVSDGYIVKTPLFNLKLRVPGEYDGTEIRLPDGVLPEPRLLPNDSFVEYIGKRVSIDFDGIAETGGLIAKAVDEASGCENEAATIGKILTISGAGLKIRADEAHRGRAGLFFEDEDGGQIQAEAVPVNKPSTLKALVPAGLTAGKAYTLVVMTQSSLKGHSNLLEELRETRSAFTLTVRA